MHPSSQNLNVTTYHLSFHQTFMTASLRLPNTDLTCKRRQPPCSASGATGASLVVPVRGRRLPYSTSCAATALPLYLESCTGR